MLAVCYGLKYLKWARPAARSFVRENLLAGFLPDLFPSSFATSINCQSLVHELGREAEWANRSWQTLGEAYGYDEREHFFPLRIGPDRAVIFNSPDASEIFTALARADFDGDGLEDVLLRLERWNLNEYPGTLQQRYGPATEVAILTQAAPGGRFWTLYSKTGESCFHFNLEKWKDYAEPWERKKADRFRPPYRLEDLGPPVH